MNFISKLARDVVASARGYVSLIRYAATLRRYAPTRGTAPTASEDLALAAGTARRLQLRAAERWEYGPFGTSRTIENGTGYASRVRLSTAGDRDEQFYRPIVKEVNVAALGVQPGASEDAVGRTLENGTPYQADYRLLEIRPIGDLRLVENMPGSLPLQGNIEFVDNTPRGDENGTPFVGSAPAQPSLPVRAWNWLTGK